MDRVRLSSTSALGPHPQRLHFRRPFLFWAITILVSTFVGIVFVSRYYFLTVLGGSRNSFTVEMAVWGIIGWWMWIVLTPIVFFLAQRFPVDRSTWRRSLSIHLLGWIGILILDASLFSLVQATYRAWTSDGGVGLVMMFQENLISSAAVDLLVYTAVVGVVHAMAYRQRLHERDIAASQLEMQLTRARFQALEMQVQPHFLFNTLHTIHALMDVDTAAARRVLTLLSDLLRATLRSREQHHAPLYQEVAFLERYLEIQRIRFRDHLDVSMDVAPDVWNARVPSLILQPIVENAFKHGLSPAGDVSRIRIRAFREGDTLVLQVTDNGPGMPRKGGFPFVKKGIGLRNTEERIQQLYQGKGILLFEEAAEGGMRVSARIPYQAAAARSGVPA